MNDRISWIEHKGARILYADYSGLDEHGQVQTIEAFKNELLKQAPGSVATLTNVKDTEITDKVKEKYKELAAETQGISKGTAAIGVTGFKKVLAGLIKRDMYWASDMEEAKEWLAERANG
jgi:hypothetical protein